MTTMMIMLPVLLAAARMATARPDACLTLESESVLARDIVSAIPAFSQFPPDFLLGYVTSSGAPRVFHGADLERIAKNRGADLHGLPDVCFARKTFIPQETQIQKAIRDAIQATAGDQNARIEVIASSQRQAPSGELVFPRDGVQLSASGQSDVMWHGFVRFGVSGKFPVWARVKITATMTRVIAITDIANGKPIQPGQVRLETCEDSPLDELTARNLEEVVGNISKMTIRSMTPIRKAQIERPPDVTRGDLVRVEVFEGAAHLVIEGHAESSGMKGSTILVRNPASGKDFRAQVTGKGVVTIGEMPVPTGGPIQ
jgi:flagella basal body P-ring formation protein FlgA